MLTRKSKVHVATPRGHHCWQCSFSWRNTDVSEDNVYFIYRSLLAASPIKKKKKKKSKPKRHRKHTPCLSKLRLPLGNFYLSQLLFCCWYFVVVANVHKRVWYIIRWQYSDSSAPSSVCLSVCLSQSLSLSLSLSLSVICFVVVVVV